MVRLTLALLLLPLAAAAQPRDEVWLKETALGAFFHVGVTGTPMDPANPLHNATRSGKAFAIGENRLVTASHVLGERSEWKPARLSNDEITRALRPLERKIALTHAAAPNRPLSGAIVTPTPADTIDAAGLTVPDLKLASYFELSLCEIIQDAPYTALLTGAAQPGTPGSVEDVVLVDLTAAGYDPQEYGGLYVFDTESAAFTGEPWGHDGSPIFDAEFNVVALVSAVTLIQGKYKFLATPIQPLFPGAVRILAQAPVASEGGGPPSGLKCSMADMVRRIHDQVATHASWSVRVATDDGLPPGTLELSYESVADPPNIESIEVRYDFIGEQVQGDQEIRIAYPGSEKAKIEISQSRSRMDRAFSTTEVFRAGRTVVEPFLADEGDGGSIHFVRLTITPTYTDGKTLRRRKTVREIQWSAFE